MCSALENALLRFFCVVRLTEKIGREHNGRLAESRNATRLRKAVSTLLGRQRFNHSPWPKIYWRTYGNAEGSGKT